MPRKFLPALLAVSLLSTAAPGAAIAGPKGAPQPPKPPKCDPAVEVCDNGRKNG